MPLVNPYCTLISVQRETGNSDSDLTAWFEECINSASRWIDDHCNTTFLLRDYSLSELTIMERDVLADSIYVPWPIITLTKVASTEGVVDANRYAYEVGRRAITLRDRSNWTVRDSTLLPRSAYQVAYGGLTPPFKVTGTFGYTTPPASVSRACTKIASAWSHEKRRERVAQDGSRTSLLDERIPDDAITLLKRFRRLVY